MVGLWIKENQKYLRSIEFFDKEIKKLEKNKPKGDKN